MCYVGNIGDSRAILSADGGEKILRLSKDHKPEDEDEKNRIERNGGKIYQNSSYIPDGQGGMQLIVGPFRAFPGRLSVSRTIGDIEAKLPHLGGNPNVVVATSDIKSFKIRNNHDFIMIGCDGIFEKLDNIDVNEAVWEASKPQAEFDDRTIHEKLGASVDAILQMSAFKKSFDNITAVIVAFENYENVSTTMSGRTARHAIEEDIIEDGPEAANETIKETIVVQADTNQPAMQVIDKNHSPGSQATSLNQNSGRAGKIVKSFNVTSQTFGEKKSHH